jgi:hypothetical protein
MTDTASIEFVRASNGDGFVLSRTTIGGKKTRIPLTSDQVLGLQETIALLQDQLLSRFRSGSEVKPIYVLHVSGAILRPEAVGERVLLTLAAPTGHETTHALPRETARFIADKIPEVLDQMPQQTRQ